MSAKSKDPDEVSPVHLDARCFPRTASFSILKVSTFLSKSLGCLWVLMFAMVPHALAQHKLDADGKQALPYVKIAADVALSVQKDSLNNFLAIFITYRDSDQALQDDDLAPFMKIKQAEPAGGRSTVCFFSAKKDTAICVYFSEKRPFGVVTAKAAADGKMGDVAAGYRPVTRDMIAKDEHKLRFDETTVRTDSGAGLTGFLVTTE